MSKLFLPRVRDGYEAVEVAGFVLILAVQRRTESMPTQQHQQNEK